MNKHRTAPCFWSAAAAALLVPTVFAAGILVASVARADNLYNLYVYCEDSPNPRVIFSYLVKNNYAGSIFLCAGRCGGRMVPIADVLAGLPDEVSTGLTAHLEEHEANAAAGKGQSLALCGGGDRTGVDRSCTVEGSIVDVQNQALGETIRIGGTPFSLHYRSDRIKQGRPDSFPNSLAGWSVNAHHAYETGGKVLHTGDGRRRIARSASAQAGGEIRIPSEDGTILYVFDGKGRHLRTLNSMTGTLHYRFVYDDVGGLARIEDSYGNAIRIERDAKGAPTAIIAPGGQRTTLVTGPDGYLASIANPAGESTRLSYSREGWLSVLADPRGQRHRFTYSSQGLLLKDENPAGGHWALARTRTGSGFKVALSSALGRASVYEVERLATGEERRLNTSPGGAAIRVEKNKEGNDRITRPDGTVSVSEFQPDPRWSKQAPLLKSFSLTTPSGLASTLSLNRAVGLADPSNPLSLQSLTDTFKINGRTYTLTFDAGKKQVGKRTPAGRQAVMTVNDQGRVVKAEAPGLLPIQFTYDNRGRLTTITQGAGTQARVMRVGHDAAGQVATISDPLKREVRFQYDEAGRVKKQAFGDGREIAFDWNANGNLQSLTPPGKPAHRFGYTPANLTEAYHPPQIGTAATATTYAYNEDRQLTRLTRPDGKEIGLTYDKAGRLDTLSTPGGAYKLAFDKTDKPQSIAGPDGTLSFGYDGFLPTRTIWEGSIRGTVARGFDNDFRTASLSVNGARPVELRYDADGLLTQAGALILDRDLMNGRVKGTELGKLTTTIEYNGFGERQRFAAAFNGKEIFAVQYERDALGRIVKQIETIQGQTDAYHYDYDLAGRLADVSKNGNKVGHYEYDGNGNRLLYKGRRGEFKGSYDAQDRILSSGNIAFKHTANGEWLSRTEDGKTTSYNYDVLGNLRAVDLPDGTKIEYLIDGANRRIGKKVNGKLVQGFLWQSRLRPIAELDGAGNVVSRFVYGTGVNVPEYMEKGGKTYRIITDHLGSVRLVVDVATGQVAQRMDYDEFGNVLEDISPGFQPFGFAGGIYDPQTQLIRFGVRDYDAASGRWTAKDPMTFSGGDANVYAYVSNGPQNLVDPEGLQLSQSDEQELPPDWWEREVPWWEREVPDRPSYDYWWRRLAKRYWQGWTIRDWYSECPTQPGDAYRWRLSMGAPGNDDRFGGFGRTDVGYGNKTDRWTDAWISRNPTTQESPPVPRIGIRFEWWERGFEWSDPEEK